MPERRTGVHELPNVSGWCSLFESNCARRKSSARGSVGFETLRSCSGEVRHALGCSVFALFGVPWSTAFLGESRIHLGYKKTRLSPILAIATSFDRRRPGSVCRVGVLAARRTLRPEGFERGSRCRRMRGSGRWNRFPARPISSILASARSGLVGVFLGVVGPGGSIFGIERGIYHVIRRCMS